MFMHGNGEIVDYWPDEFMTPRAWGAGVLLVEYPGYGRAPGAPSEKSITESVLALYDWAANNPRVDAKRIVAYGRSLGGGAAARLAVNRPVAALILESTFTSVADFAARLHGAGVPGSRSVRQPHRRWRRIAGRCSSSTASGHARAVRPMAASSRPSFLARSFIELNCGHNDCPRDWETIGAFLAPLGVVKPVEVALKA